MSKKWMIIVGVVALVLVALVAVRLLMPPETSSSTTAGSSTSTGTGSNGSTTTTSTGSGGSTTATSTSSKGSGTSTGTASSGGKTSTSSSSSTAATLKPFPPLPDSQLPAHAATSPANAGETLAPLTAAPDSTISALRLGIVPEGARYAIVMRPYGIGPSSAFGSRIAIRVDSATPLGTAPANSQITNANLLVLVDTTNGGTVTKGGTYKATLTFLSDGAKLWPVLSSVKAAQ